MLTEELNTLAARVGVAWFQYQVDAFDGMGAQAVPLRACLYYKTGAGKSLTSLVAVRQSGYSHAVVVTPPSTFDRWEADAAKLGMTVQCMSHAKFRMKDTLLSRSVPLIADEMHMFGGHNGKGWTKLDRLARGLQAPMILASATPNYNDAERVYCVKHILDPAGTSGGYLAFLHANCNTVHNPYSQTPDVDEEHPFKNHASAVEFLASLPGVYYLADDLVWSIDDLDVSVKVSQWFELYGYDERSKRILASIIETKHKRIQHSLITREGYLEDDAYDLLTQVAGESSTPLLVFAAHSTVADAIGRSLWINKVKHAVITGTTPPKKKLAYLQAFRDGVLDVLVGTASLATGTDGLDKVCDTLVIADDTEDPSLRRQVVGRIMPRGKDSDASGKKVYRLVLS